MVLEGAVRGEEFSELTKRDSFPFGTGNNKIFFRGIMENKKSFNDFIFVS